MFGAGSKENYARERIVLAISLFQKNALPLIAKHIRGLMRALHIAYKTLVRMCSSNGSLRRFGVAKARQLAGFVSVLATQLAKWRRLIDFIASKAIYIKDMVAKKANKAEQAPSVASENQDPPLAFVDDAVEVAEAEEEPTQLIAPKGASIPQNEDTNMNALAKYSSLDAIQAKNAVTKSPSKKKGNDKIAARRRRR
jgi:hypothetical protein